MTLVISGYSPLKATSFVYVLNLETFSRNDWIRSRSSLIYQSKAMMTFRKQASKMQSGEYCLVIWPESFGIFCPVALRWELPPPTDI